MCVLCRDHVTTGCDALFSRAYYILFFILQKVFTLSHRSCFLLIFMRFECEWFDYKAFTPGGRLVKGLREQVFTQETVGNQGDAVV